MNSNPKGQGSIFDNRWTRRLPVVSRKPVFSFASPGRPKIVRGDRLYRYADGAQFEVTAVEPNGA